MEERTLISPAKINLTLDVLGKDERSGKHFLNTFFYRHDELSDEIVLRKRQDQHNVLHCDYPGIAKGSMNTVLQALDLLGEKGWEVSIKKQIPIGAGLGGGSSNAGSVLKFFGQQKRIPVDHLMPLARQIGADVAFFLLDENLAYAEGFGDEIQQSWNIPSLPIQLIRTGISVSTAEAYDELDLSPCGKGSVKTEALLKKLQNASQLDMNDILPYVHNDFEASFFNKYPQLKGQGSLCGSGGMMWKFFQG